MNTYLLIDGNAIMHRAYHAIPPFKTKDGTPTNVIYGFFSMLHKVIGDFKPGYLIVCFDVKGPTFRKEIFKEYKATRKKIEDDFLVQIPLVKEGLDEAGITYVEKQGYEADDLIGTISQKLSVGDNKVLILSGDKDILQLANENVLVVTPAIGYAKQKIYNEGEVLKTFGVAPSQMADFKALAGDQSDNYSGAKGIGPKTATGLLQEFGNLENILKNIAKVKSEKLQTILKDNNENILMAKKLSLIDMHVKIDLDIEKTKFEKFPEHFKQFLLKFEMYSLTNRFFGIKKSKPAEKPKEKKSSPDKNQISLF